MRDRRRGDRSRVVVVGIWGFDSTLCLGGGGSVRVFERFVLKGMGKRYGCMM